MEEDEEDTSEEVGEEYEFVFNIIDSKFIDEAKKTP